MPFHSADVLIDGNLANRYLLSETCFNSSLLSPTQSARLTLHIGYLDETADYSFATDPTATDDSSGGYSVGQTWFNTDKGTKFTLDDDTVGAAQWSKVDVNYFDAQTRAFSGATLNSYLGAAPAGASVYESVRLAAYAFAKDEGFSNVIPATATLY